MLPDLAPELPQWLEPPVSRTIFYGTKDVWAIQVRLYLEVVTCISVGMLKVYDID